MRGYLLKAARGNFPKHIKRSYANGLRWRGRVAALQRVQTVARLGRAPCLPSLLISGLHHCESTEGLHPRRRV